MFRSYPHVHSTFGPVLIGCLLSIMASTGCDSFTDVAAPSARLEPEVQEHARETGSSASPFSVAAACEPVAETTSEPFFLYQLCVPPGWNGDLVVYAHGYVSPFEPLRITEEVAELADLATSLGFAFATTSYRANGLVVLEAVEDLARLVSIFEEAYEEARYVYLAGASEGGVATALAVERRPDVFDGGLATCGPYGDFLQQLTYIADFRAVFDYFFSSVLPGHVTNIPVIAARRWETRFEPRIRQALAANPDKVRQLLNVTQAPVDPTDPATIAQTVTGLLWYNVFAAEDALQKLGGSPYDNTFRTYQGSDNDRLLNRKIKRYRADPGALIAVEQYETTGQLDVPVVTLHTTGDYLVPFEQQLLYDEKVAQAGSLGQYTSLPVERYGHCTFEPVELLAGLVTLINQVTSQPLAHAEASLSNPGDRAVYRQLMLEHEHERASR